MSISSIDLCSNALNKIGANEILSFDEGTPEADFASALYPVLKSKLLSTFSWSFATKEKEINQIVNEKISTFANAFMLPLDFLRAIQVSPKVEYKIMENKLFTNASRINLRYIANVDEEFFSPAFISAFIYALAAEFSMALIDDTSKFNLLYKLYTAELREARFLDSAQETPKAFNSFSLVDVRK